MRLADVRETSVPDRDFLAATSGDSARKTVAPTDTTAFLH
jgi:hypothetical protein